jgi:vancomycin resistance protein YoaR
LYNAVLLAELPVVERHNHSAKVHYADYGFDATIAGDYYDLKFKNDTPHPLLIVSEAQSGRLSVSLYGYDSRSAGRSLVFTAELVEVFPSPPEQLKKDPGVPTGEEWLVTESQEGYRYELYKNIYENGQRVERVKINTSIYKPVAGVVLVN